MMKAFQWHSAPLDQRLVIEASAGTGKTFSLIHLVLRLIVEKHYSIDRILMVTFTKSATAELKARIRELLLNLLNAKRQGCSKSLEDNQLKSLFDRWNQEGLLDDGRIETAIESMDDAAIYTIHGFCQLMLSENEFSNGQGYGYELQDDKEWRQRIVDAFVRDQVPLMSTEAGEYLVKHKDSLSDILNRLNSKPQSAKIDFINLPSEDSVQQELQEVLNTFAVRVPLELRQIKQKDRIRYYDDLLGDMARELNNVHFVEKVRSLFDAVLIDEFQDTDPLQYEVFSTIFIPTAKDDVEKFPKIVVFVGDPKQSIYLFRNADLNTYLKAQDELQNTQSLVRNFRSTAPLMTVFNAYFSDEKSTNLDGAFLHPKIFHREVEAGSKALPLMRELPNGALVCEPVFEAWLSTDNTVMTKKEQLEALEAEWITNDIKRLLAGNVYIDVYKKELLQAKHIAVLVRKKSAWEVLSKQFDREGIRYRKNSSEENVFYETEAMDVLQVLRVLESPDDVKLLKLARLTPIFGETLNVVTAGLMENGVDVSEQAERAVFARETILEALSLYQRRGISAALGKIFARCQTRERLLLEFGGERKLTNYQHLIERLQAKSRQLHTIAGLTRWFTREIQPKSTEVPESDKLRVESEGDLVTLMTIHNSKGLEYPVVYVAGAFNHAESTSIKNSFYRDTTENPPRWYFAIDPLTINQARVCFKAYQDEDRVDQFQRQDQEESARLAYVAMTRASRRLVLPLFAKLTKSGKWTADIQNSAYLRMLVGRRSVSKEDVETAWDEFQTNLLEKFKNPGTQDMLPSTLEAIRAMSLSFDVSDLIRIRTTDDLPIEVPDYTVRKNTIDSLEALKVLPILSDWVRTSFTGIQRLVDHEEDFSRMVDRFDEPDEETDDAQDTVFDDAGIMNLPGGTEFGSCLHALFEHVEFTDAQSAKDGDVAAFDRIRTVVEKYVRRYRMAFGQERQLEAVIERMVAMVITVLTTEISLPNGKPFRLSQLNATQRWSEMDFTFAMKKQIKGRQPLTTKRLRHLLAQFDAAYHLPSLSDQELLGYLTGSIDLAFEYEGDFWVLDWKSNKRGISKVSDYSRQWMADEIRHAQYFLQYLIYLVALKRHLKLKGIDARPAGAMYVFVRGVHPANPHQEKAVWVDEPPIALIDCLDDAFINGYDEKVVAHYAAQAHKETNHE